MHLYHPGRLFHSKSYILIQILFPLRGGNDQIFMLIRRDFPGYGWVGFFFKYFSSKAIQHLVVACDDFLTDCICVLL